LPLRGITGADAPGEDITTIIFDAGQEISTGEERFRDQGGQKGGEVNGYDSSAVGIGEKQCDAQKNRNLYGNACDIKARHGADAHQVRDHESPDMPFAMKMHLNRE
jgi:hypothetical protein